MPKAKSEDAAVEYLVEMDDEDTDPAPLAAETGDAPLVPDAEDAEEPEAEAPTGADLTQLPEFRRYQADRDREIADLQTRVERAEATRQQADLSQIQAEIEQLYTAAEDAEDPNERRRLIREAAQRETYIQFQQLQRWETYKRDTLRKEGLDPDDKRFAKPYQTAAEFEKDVLQAAVDKTRKELAALKGETGPDGQRRQQARRQYEQGRDFVDTGEPGGGTNEAALARDIEALNAGRLSPQKFAKKWGGK